jgi:hypothetical protein
LVNLQVLPAWQQVGPLKLESPPHWAYFAAQLAEALVLLGLAEVVLVVLTGAEVVLTGLVLVLELTGLVLVLELTGLELVLEPTGLDELEPAGGLPPAAGVPEKVLPIGPTLMLE